MATFKFNLFTAHSLSADTSANRFYDCLNSEFFSPTTFGEYEPVRDGWEDRDKFLDAWRKQSRLWFGQVLVRRKTPPKYWANAIFLYGPKTPRYHGVSVFDLRESQFTGDALRKLVTLGDRLFTKLGMDYGFLCLSDEYDRKNIIKNVRHPDGAIEPRHFVGMKWPDCIPGLYWINYYGNRYLEQGFSNGIVESYPSRVTVLEGGIRLQVSSDPRYFESTDGVETELELRNALGEQWFFNRESDRACHSLDVPTVLSSPDHSA